MTCFEFAGNRISAYFLPELAKYVLRVCKDFPLWSSVMRSSFESPYRIASSASVECDFKQLKTHILRFDVRPVAVDKLVVTHLKSIDSNTKLFRSKQLRNACPDNEDCTLSNKNEIGIQKSDCTSLDDDSSAESKISMNSLDEVEKWHGKGSEELLIPVKNTKVKKKR